MTKQNMKYLNRVLDNSKGRFLGVTVANTKTRNRFSGKVITNSNKYVTFGILSGKERGSIKKFNKNSIMEIA